MEDSLKRIFWGLILTSFNINIPYDMLPDFIGYVLMLSGLMRLSVEETNLGNKVNDAFKIGVIPSKIMIGVSTISWITEPFINGYPVMEKTIYLASMNILGIARIVVVFSICCGIYEIGKSIKCDNMQKSSMYNWYVFLAVSLVILIISPFDLNIYVSIERALYMLSIVGVIVQISILRLVKSAADRVKEYSNYKNWWDVN